VSLLFVGRPRYCAPNRALAYFRPQPSPVIRASIRPCDTLTPEEWQLLRRCAVVLLMALAFFGFTCWFVFSHARPPRLPVSVSLRQPCRALGAADTFSLAAPSFSWFEVGTVGSFPRVAGSVARDSECLGSGFFAPSATCQSATQAGGGDGRVPHPALGAALPGALHARAIERA
jgi:hypothetical protein